MALSQAGGDYFKTMRIPWWADVSWSETITPSEGPNVIVSRAGAQQLGPTRIRSASAFAMDRTRRPASG